MLNQPDFNFSFYLNIPWHYVLIEAETVLWEKQDFFLLKDNKHEM